MVLKPQLVLLYLVYCKLNAINDPVQVVNDLGFNIPINRIAGTTPTDDGLDQSRHIETLS